MTLTASGVSRLGRLKHASSTSLLVLISTFGGGCAVHYYDAKTGSEHVWGLAHVKMRVATGTDIAPPAIATQTESVGLGLGLDASESYAHLGWNRRSLIRVPDDTAVSFAWPTTDLFDVRVGGRPPFLRPAADASPTPAAPASFR